MLTYKCFTMNIPEENSFLHIVEPADNNKRLDKCLALHMPDLTRSRIQQLIEQDQVTLNGKICHSRSVKIKQGDEISLTIPPLEPTDIPALPIDLDIVFEDEHLLVINKQAGLTTHPGAGNYDNTLVNALLYHCGDSLSGIGGVERPGIVHRLDKDTSGLMVAAKHDIAHQSLSSQLQERELTRKYECFVWNTPFPPVGNVDESIGRHPQHRVKMMIAGQQARHAVTHYTVLESFAGGYFSHVECQLETGRTHQIRVHMQHLGHPLIGDPLYGSKHRNMKKDSMSDEAQAAIRAFPRQALHSKYIAFTHPVTGEHLEFHKEMKEGTPKDMAELYEILQRG